MKLDQKSLRVLGALMEKEMTTPDLYPLSVNALVNASNQRSSRDPVMNVTEEDVRSALDVLMANDLAAPARDGGRAAKFEHRIRTVLNLRRDETAVICLLLLRGAQTPGELRSRADRMFSFTDLEQVQSALERLAGREEPLAAALPRAPGARETRFVHLLGDVETDPAAFAEATPGGDLARLETRVEALEARINALEARSAVAPGDDR